MTVIYAVNATAGLCAARGDDRSAGVLHGAAEAATAERGIEFTASDALITQQLLERPRNESDRRCGTWHARKGGRLPSMPRSIERSARRRSGSWSDEATVAAVRSR